MSETRTESVELSTEVLHDVRERAEARGFDSTEEYIEYVLKVVLSELSPVETDSEEDEEAIRSRLESLGYLDT